MKLLSKKIIVAFLAALLIFSFSAAALAADTTVDLNKKGSITVSLKETPDGEPLNGISFTLYKVGDPQIVGSNLVFDLTEEFAGAGVDLRSGDYTELAAHLAAYAEEKNISGTVQSSSGDTVVFSRLSVGMYLLVDNGETEGYYPADPFLVSLPMTGADGAYWEYDITACPKVEPRPEPPIPGNTQLTVKKVWANTETNIPASVKVVLLKDGVPVDTVVLRNENGWTYTWNDLDPYFRWNAVELDVPDGYTVSYSVSGDTVTVINTAQKDVPVVPVTLTVKKVWDDNGEDRPSSVKVKLLENGAVRDTVVLSEENGWMYTWYELSPDSSWGAKEASVPNGYTAYYDRVGNCITITNSASLIQTGQLIWPIPVLAGTGLLLFILGWVLVFLRGKKNEAK